MMYARSGLHWDEFGLKTGRSLISLGTVFLLHVLGIHILTNSIHAPVQSALADGRLVTVFIQPKIRDTSPLKEPDLSRLTFLVENDESIYADVPSVDFNVSRNEGSSIAAPTLKGEPSVSIVPYVTQASLFPGQGATVVLRIEVLETGEPGRIEVDGSSGSHRIDEAAISYARALRWYPGRSNGKPHITWIRWGVRLQA